MTATQLEARFGYFDLFMRNYGLAPQAVRDELWSDVQLYEAGAESGDALVWQTSELLDIPLPQPGL